MGLILTHFFFQLIRGGSSWGTNCTFIDSISVKTKTNQVFPIISEIFFQPFTTYGSKDLLVTLVDGEKYSKKYLSPFSIEAYIVFSEVFQNMFCPYPLPPFSLSNCYNGYIGETFHYFEKFDLSAQKVESVNVSSCQKRIQVFNDFDNLEFNSLEEDGILKQENVWKEKRSLCIHQFVPDHCFYKILEECRTIYSSFLLKKTPVLKISTIEQLKNEKVKKNVNEYFVRNRLTFEIDTLNDAGFVIRSICHGCSSVGLLEYDKTILSYENTTSINERDSTESILYTVLKTKEEEEEEEEEEEKEEEEEEVLTESEFFLFLFEDVDDDKVPKETLLDFHIEFKNGVEFKVSVSFFRDILSFNGVSGAAENSEDYEFFQSLDMNVNTDGPYHEMTISKEAAQNFDYFIIGEVEVDIYPQNSCGNGQECFNDSSVISLSSFEHIIVSNQTPEEEDNTIFFYYDLDYFDNVLLNGHYIIQETYDVSFYSSSVNNTDDVLIRKITVSSRQYDSVFYPEYLDSPEVIPVVVILISTVLFVGTTISTSVSLGLVIKASFSFVSAQKVLGNYPLLFGKYIQTQNEEGKENGILVVDLSFKYHHKKINLNSPNSSTTSTLNKKKKRKRKRKTVKKKEANEKIQQEELRLNTVNTSSSIVPPPPPPPPPPLIPSSSSSSSSLFSSYSLSEITGKVGGFLKKKKKKSTHASSFDDDDLINEDDYNLVGKRLSDHKRLSFVRASKNAVYGHCKFCFNEQQDFFNNKENLKIFGEDAKLRCIKCGIPLMNFIGFQQDEMFCVVCSVFNKYDTKNHGRCMLHLSAPKKVFGSNYVLYKNKYTVACASKKKKSTKSSERLDFFLNDELWKLNNIMKFEYLAGLSGIVNRELFFPLVDEEGKEAIQESIDYFRRRKRTIDYIDRFTLNNTLELDVSTGFSIENVQLFRKNIKTLFDQVIKVLEDQLKWIQHMEQPNSNNIDHNDNKSSGKKRKRNEFELISRNIIPQHHHNPHSLPSHDELMEFERMRRTTRESNNELLFENPIESFQPNSKKRKLNSIMDRNPILSSFTSSLFGGNNNNDNGDGFFSPQLVFSHPFYENFIMQNPIPPVPPSSSSSSSSSSISLSNHGQRMNGGHHYYYHAFHAPKRINQQQQQQQLSTSSSTAEDTSISPVSVFLNKNMNHKVLYGRNISDRLKQKKQEYERMNSPSPPQSSAHNISFPNNDNSHNNDVGINNHHHQQQQQEMHYYTSTNYENGLEQQQQIHHHQHQQHQQQQNNNIKESNNNNNNFGGSGLLASNEEEGGSGGSGYDSSSSPPEDFLDIFGNAENPRHNNPLGIELEEERNLNLEEFLEMTNSSFSNEKNSFYN